MVWQCEELGIFFPGLWYFSSVDIVCKGWKQRRRTVWPVYVDAG